MGDSRDDDGLARDLADLVDPVTHAQAAALLETAKETGHIADWQTHPGTGASFRPPAVMLTNQHLYAVSVDDHRWRPVSGDLIVTMVRGLLEGNLRADIDALTASIKKTGEAASALGEVLSALPTDEED